MDCSKAQLPQIRSSAVRLSDWVDDFAGTLTRVLERAWDLSPDPNCASFLAKVESRVRTGQPHPGPPARQRPRPRRAAGGRTSPNWAPHDRRARGGGSVGALALGDASDAPLSGRWRARRNWAKQSHGRELRWLPGLGARRALVEVTRRVFAGNLPAVALLAAGAPSSALATPAESFAAIYTTEWTWRSAEFPDEEDPSKPIPSRLPAVSAADQARRLDYWRDVRARLRAIDPSSLDVETRIDFAVYTAQIDALIASQMWRDWEKPLNSDTAFWSDLTTVSRRTFHTESDYRNYVTRLRQFPRYFGDQTNNMRAGLARGFTPPKVTLKGRDLSSPRSVARSGLAGNHGLLPAFQDHAGHLLARARHPAWWRPRARPPSRRR